MEILEAFCVEHDRDMDIYEAQQVYFATPFAERKRFEFRCSDEACRKALNPLVVGANYHKDAEDSEKYRQPYFKSHTNHPHIEACIWQRGSSNSRLLFADDEGGSRDDPPKVTNVIDVFDPRHTDTVLTVRKTVGEKKEPGDVKGNGDGDGADCRPKTREGYSTTPRLERFIDCWAQHGREQQKKHHVTIEGRTLSYYQAVLPSTMIRPHENGSRIIHGGVRISFWPKDNPRMLYLNFMDGCTHFKPVGETNPSSDLTIELPLARVEKYLGGARLLHCVKQAQSPGHYLKAYAWGEIKPRPGKAGYALELKSLDNLVLKAIVRKSPA